MQFDEGREMRTRSTVTVVSILPGQVSARIARAKEITRDENNHTFAEDGDILYTITCVQEG
jgi:hypothetical protein